MKRFMQQASLMALLLFCSAAFAMQKPAGSDGKQTQPASKHVPQAKTHSEFNDYNAAYAIPGGAASEKAADEFAAKYPDSELKSFLYAKAMHEYQNENNPSKILVMGDKVLQLEPENTIALVLTASVLADSLGDADQDRAQKIAVIRKNSGRALDTVDSAFTPPANSTPEQVDVYKKTLQSMAHSALGIMELKTGDDSGAEKELKAAANLNTAQPDAYVWYHLALAQDHQKKYPEALVSIEQTLRYASSNPDLARLAQGEQKRLQMLTGATMPAEEKSQSPAGQPPVPK
jgi:tetratricopeptide (TPR) repeat protein